MGSSTPGGRFFPPFRNSKVLPAVFQKCALILCSESVLGVFSSVCFILVLTGFHHLTWRPWHHFLCFFCSRFFELLEYVKSYFLPYVEKRQPLVFQILSPLLFFPSGAPVTCTLHQCHGVPILPHNLLPFLCIHHLDSFYSYSSSSLTFFFSV